MSLAVKVEDLSKRYRLGVINRDMLYKDLQSRWAKFRGKEDPNAPLGFKHDKRLEHGDEFWALRNVDLEDDKTLKRFLGTTSGLLLCKSQDFTKVCFQH